MRLIATLVLAFSVCASALVAQAGSEPEKDAPRTLEEAVAHLRKTLPTDTLQRLRTADETVVHELHFGTGLNIRNGWGLWSGGPLYESLKALGLRHPDDMSGLILTCLWRSLHDVPWNVDKEVRLYQTYWRYAAHPDPKSNPHCSPIEVTQSYSPAFEPKVRSREDLRLQRQVHLGKCCADGRVWAYDADRGWYPAGAKELAVWDSEGSSRYDPCKTKALSGQP